MSPEEERKERLAQFVLLTALAAMTASAVGGLFWAAAHKKESEPSTTPDLIELEKYGWLDAYNQKIGLRNNRR